jgi:spermidine synthase
MAYGSPDPPAAPGWRIPVVAFSLGVTSLVTQVILIREFLSVFYGNELVIGVLFASWMLLTGSGAFLGRFAKTNNGSSGFLAVLLMLFGSLPVLTVFLLRLLRNVVLPVGTMEGIAPIIGSSLLLLAPFCILIGLTFTILCALARGSGGHTVGTVYAVEAMGSFAGGLVYSLFLVSYLNTFQSLSAILAFNVAIALTVVRGTDRAWRVVWTMSALLLVPLIVVDVDRLASGFLHPGEEVLFSKDTPYGTVTVTRRADQENFYENGTLLTSANDASGAEEPVHYAMIQHPLPKSVLMVSGVLTGATKEVLKYVPDRLDVVEINPVLIDLARVWTKGLDDRGVEVFAKDARVFVRQTRRRYDVVLLNVPEPSTLQINRYYTSEFFEDVKRIMNPGGIVSTGALPGAEYQSDDAARINATMMNTLKPIFRHVLVVPGNRVYFLASDSVLSVGIANLVEQRGIPTTYVNKYYLDDEDLGRRSSLIQSGLASDASVNRDLVPVSYLRHAAHWLGFFQSNLLPIVLLFAGFVLVVLLRLDSLSAGVMTGGFAASSVEILLLLAYQILCGHIFQMLGIIIALFMAGLAAGSHLAQKISPQRRHTAFIKAQWGIGVFCFLLPFALIVLQFVRDYPVLVNPAICFLALTIASIVGAEFSLATLLKKGETQSIASELYGIDLIGSALGALLAGAYLIPALGFSMMCFIAGSLSVLSSLAAVLGRKPNVTAIE